MTRFTLDPNAASGSLKGQPKVTARFKAEAPDSVCLSVVTEGEMLFGVARRPEAIRLRAAVGPFGRTSNARDSRSARST